MPNLIPFKALLPDEAWLDSVSIQSSDFQNEEEMAEALRSNPNAFLHVTKMPIIHPGKYENPMAFLPDARKFVLKLISEGVMIAGEEESLFILQQTINGIQHRGIIGLCDMEDYGQNHIKRHEFTRHEREAFISELIRQTGVIGEPLLLSHHHRQSLEDLLDYIVSNEVDRVFEKGGVKYEIWQVKDPVQIGHIVKEMNETNDFYIMDGHHRIASVSNIYEEEPTESNRYALAYVLDANQLTIGPFHRYVRGVDISEEKVLEKLLEEFECEEVEDYVLHPGQQRSFVMKCESGTYRLSPKHSWGGLDVGMLEEKILRDIFEIKDTRSDQRVEFLEGEGPLHDAIESAKMAGNFLFVLHPCTFREIAMTSDAGKVLPPKSTFVEPKCRAGIFVQPYGIGV